MATCAPFTRPAPLGHVCRLSTTIGRHAASEPPRLSRRLRRRSRRAPALGAVAASRRRRRRDRRGRRGRHRGGAPDRGRGTRFALIEATDQIGGRCVTDTRDLRRAVRPRRALDPHAGHQSGGEARGAAQGSTSIRRRPGRRLRIGRRYAREGEMEDFLSALVRANRAIGEARAARPTSSCAQALPKDLGDWRPTVEFVLGPFGCAKDLAEVSALDFAKSAERDVDAFCRQGFGDAAREARRRAAGPAVDAGDGDRLGAARTSRSRPPRGASRRAP